MSYPENDLGTVSQSSYWMYFLGCMVGAVAVLVGGVSLVLKGSYVMGVVCVLLVLPLSLYFRVIMMRRCRAIGWPVFLPWLTLFLTYGFGLVSGMFTARHPYAIGQSLSGAAGFGALIGLVDFVFQIVIGCIGSKDDSAAPFRDDDVPYARPQPLPQPIVPVRNAPYVQGPPRQVSGFGRRGL